MPAPAPLRSLLAPLAALVLAAPAAAAPPASSPPLALAEALAQAPSTPDLALACAPAGTVLTTLGRALQGAGGELDPTGQALLDTLLRPDGVTELGIEPAGPLALSIWRLTASPRGVLSLPFSGDAAAAEATMRTLGMDARPVPDTPGVWVATDGEDSTVARLADGALSFAFDGDPPAQTDRPPVDRGLVEGLPAADGCAVWLAVGPSSKPVADRLELDDGFAIAGFVPFTRGSQGVLRVRPGGALPDALSRAGVAPVTGTSPDAPSLVGAISPSAADLLLDPGVQQALDLRPAPARRALKVLNVGPGSTWALFGAPEALDFVVVLPLDPARGPVAAAKVERRLRRLVRKLDLDLLYAEPGSMVVAAGKRQLHFQIRDGRVVVAADGARAVMAADGQGAPWVSPDDLRWSLQWPVSVWTGAGGPGIQGYAVRVRLGLRQGEQGPTDAPDVGEVLEAGVQVQTDAPTGVLTAFLTALASQQLGDRGVVGPASSADPVGDLERDLEGIALAQERYFQAHGRYLATPMAPRPLASLDAQVAPWLSPGTWHELGWAPDPPQTHAVYQVELLGEGYAVHAWLDLDGDGEPAHYLRTHAAPIERLSPEGVR